jgi:HlyD family secretion protein
LVLPGRGGAIRPSSFEVLILAIVLIAAMAISYTLYARETGLNDSSTEAPPNYIPVFRTNLSSSITSTGTVQATQSVTLNFASSGEIAEINVKAGDRVEAGQTLARLNDSQLQSAKRSAQTQLASAQARLDSSLHPSPAQLASSQEAILTAQVQVQKAQKDLDDLRARPTAADLATAQQAVNTALNGLQSANDALAKAQQDVVAAQDAVDDADDKLDDDYDNLRLARNELDDAESACSDAPDAPRLPSKGSKATGAPFLSATVDCDAAPAALTAYKAAHGAYGSSVSAYNASITDLAGKQTALTNARNALNNGNLQRSIQNAQVSVTTAQDDLVKTRAGATPLEITTAEAALASAKASLLSVEESNHELINPRPDVILPLQTSVDQAAESLAAAQEALDEATITAPFSGVITAVNGSVGGQASGSGSSTNANASGLITLLNPSQIRIDASVDQTDISEVKAGQTARVTFDALPGSTYQATVYHGRPDAGHELGRRHLCRFLRGEHVEPAGGYAGAVAGDDGVDHDDDQLDAGRCRGANTLGPRQRRERDGGRQGRKRR